MQFRENNGPFNIWAETETTVEFYDCDSMRIVWHGNYFNYFEIGRRALLNKIGYNYFDMEKSGYFFPIIEVSAKYLKPLQFTDQIRIKSILVEYENCLRIKYEIRNIQTGLLTTKGISTQMAFDMKTKESCIVTPDVLINKVESLLGREKL